MGKRAQVLARPPPGLQRRFTRAAKGSLRRNRIAPKTLERYIYATVYFAFFASAFFGGVPNCWETMDIVAMEFLECLWSEGESRSIAADALSGLQFFLHTKRRLAGSWGLLSTWQRMELPNRAPPLPEKVLLALAGIAWSISRPDIAATLLISFYCMLRTGEGLNALIGNIFIGDDFTGVIALPFTKIGQQRGKQEMVTITNPAVGMRLAEAMKGRMPGEKLLQCSAAQFAHWFTSVLNLLGLGMFGFRCYSLRRGGATYDFSAKGDLASTLFRGRWSSSQVARIYITEGMGLLAQMQFSKSTLSLLQQCADLLDRPCGH